MASLFREFIRLLLDGDSVDAATINHTFGQIGGNARYLFDQLELAAKGETVFAREQVLEANAKTGQPVYYDAVNNRWARGLASAEIDADGNLVVSQMAQVWGIVYSKYNNTLGDLLLMGNAEIELSQAIRGEVVSGQYHLSATSPGYLQLQAPSITIPVLQVAGLGQRRNTHQVFVKPNFLDLIGQHKHYQFEMVAEPAGNAIVSGGQWVITTPDPAVEGWLPADHASFNGEAPAGAKFGYNLSQSKLGVLWPPNPVDSAVMELNPGADTTHLGMTVPTGPSPTGLLIFDACGIWWMSDCGNEVPWPSDVTTTSTTTSTTTTSTTTSTTTTAPPPPISTGSLWWNQVTPNRLQHIKVNGTDLTNYNFVPDTSAPADIALDTPGEQVFWIQSSRDKVYRGNSNGTGQTLILDSTPGGFANGQPIFWIEYDPVGDRLYLAVGGGNEFWIANPDGSGAVQLFDGPVAAPPGDLNFAVDAGLGEIYRCDGPSIKVYDLSGTVIRTVTPSQAPRYVGLSIPDGKLYFIAEKSGDTTLIKRINIDGTVEENVVSYVSPSGVIESLTVDPVSERVYYQTVEPSVRKIQYRNYNIVEAPVTIHTRPGSDNLNFVHFYGTGQPPTTTTTTTSTTTTTTSTTTTTTPAPVPAQTLWVAATGDPALSDDVINMDYDGSGRQVYYDDGVRSAATAVCIDNDGGNVYWAQQGGSVVELWRSDTDQVSLKVRVDSELSLLRPVGSHWSVLAFDTLNRTIYVTSSDGRLFRADQNGLGAVQLVDISPTGSIFTSLAIDAPSNKIYASGTFDDIRVYDLDGLLVSTIVAGKPIRSLAIDAGRNMLFYSGTDNDELIRSTLTGVSPSVIANMPAGTTVWRLASDPLNERLYIAGSIDAFVEHTIYRIDYSGTPGPLTAIGPKEPSSIRQLAVRNAAADAGDDLFWFRRSPSITEQSDFDIGLVGTFNTRYTQGGITYDGVHDYVVYAEGNNVYRNNRAGTAESLVTSGEALGLGSLLTVSCLDYDPYTRYLYLSFIGAGVRVWRCKIDGSAGEEVFTLAGANAHSISVDSQIDRIYISDNTDLHAYDLSGSLVTTVSSVGGALVANRIDHELYASNHPSIGSGGPTTVTRYDSGLSVIDTIYSQPDRIVRGLAYDHLAQTVYLFVANGDNTFDILRTARDGSSPQLLLDNRTGVDSGQHPIDVATVESLPTTTTTSTTSTTTTSTTTTSTTTTSTTTTTTPAPQAVYLGYVDYAEGDYSTQRGDLDLTVVGPHPDAYRFRFDPINSKLISVDQVALHVIRTDLDGTNPETIIEDADVAPDVTSIQVVDIDPRDRQLYFVAFRTSGGEVHICRSDLDGTNIEIIVSTTLDTNIRAIRVNSKYDSIYVSYKASDINRYDLNGVLKQSMVGVGKLIEPDRNTGSIFYGVPSFDMENESVYRNTKPDRTGPNNIVLPAAAGRRYQWIGYDHRNQKLYAIGKESTDTFNEEYSVWRANPDGSGFETLLTGVVTPGASDAGVDIAVAKVEDAGTSTTTTSTTTTTTPSPVANTLWYGTPDAAAPDTDLTYTSEDGTTHSLFDTDPIGPTNFAAALDPWNNRVFFTNGLSIWKSPINNGLGGTVTKVIDSSIGGFCDGSQPTECQYDPVYDRVYAVADSSYIWAVAPDGGLPTLVLDSSSRQINAYAVHAAINRIFVSRSWPGSPRIEHFDLAGNLIDTTMVPQALAGMAVDVVNDQLYWTWVNGATAKSELVRANTDATLSSQTVLNSVAATTGEFERLAINVVTQKIFYVEDEASTSTNYVKRVDYIGANETLIRTFSTYKPAGWDVHDQFTVPTPPTKPKIFWLREPVFPSDKELYTVNTDGTGYRSIATFDSDNYYPIFIDPQNQRLYVVKSNSSDSRPRIYDYDGNLLSTWPTHPISLTKPVGPAWTNGSGYTYGWFDIESRRVYVQVFDGTIDEAAIYSFAPDGTDPVWVAFVDTLINGLCTMADEDLLFTSRFTEDITRWRISTGQLLGTIDPFGDNTSIMAMFPDLEARKLYGLQEYTGGKRLFSCDPDGTGAVTVRLWPSLSSFYTPNELLVDDQNGHVFYKQRLFNPTPAQYDMWRIDTDGNNELSILHEPPAYVGGQAIHVDRVYPTTTTTTTTAPPAPGKSFWWSEAGANLKHRDLDGNDDDAGGEVEFIVDWAGLGIDPANRVIIDFVFDNVNEKIFITNGSHVIRADTNSLNQEIIGEWGQGGWDFSGAIRSMYWQHAGSKLFLGVGPAGSDGEVWDVNSDGTGVTQKVSSTNSGLVKSLIADATACSGPAGRIAVTTASSLTGKLYKYDGALAGSWFSAGLEAPLTYRASTELIYSRTSDDGSTLDASAICSGSSVLTTGFGFGSHTLIRLAYSSNPQSRIWGLLWGDGDPALRRADLPSVNNQVTVYTFPTNATLMNILTPGDSLSS